MIVRQVGDRLQLITQPDHARLARQIMDRCVLLDSHPRRDAILHGVAEHDNGWAEEDASPRVNATTGQVIDFVNAPADIRQRVWPRGVARLAADPWAAALVAQHAIVVYGRFHSDPEWAPFFADLERRRDAMLGASGLSLEGLLSDYVFVRLADLISLSFCTGWNDELRFDHWAVRLSGAHVVVTPDAFDGAEIPFEISAREIENRPFRSDDDLRDSLTAARPTTLRGRVSARRV